ncbi:hypothetical protein Drorol1_Dr00010762 [Drosera rotundifolia]
MEALAVAPAITTLHHSQIKRSQFIRLKSTIHHHRNHHRFLNLHSHNPNFNSRITASVADHSHSHNHNHTHNHNNHNQNHSHSHNHKHNHNHNHNRHHDDHEHRGEYQEGVIRFAKAIGWMDLADYLRENLHLCCVSVGLFVAAAVCPKLVPKPVVRPVQNAFILIAFPLVGISAAFDALVDVAGGKVNIHVLMALAAFASVFMGNPVEGGLLIAMFNLAHIAEEYFTSRSMVDVKELKESYPESAPVLDVDSDGPTSMSDLKYTKVPLTDIKVGSFILVQAGESVPVDCEVSQGRSTVTIEHLTGEVKPMERSVGDNIPGGARNLDGMLIVKATKSWKESTLSRIVQLTEEAQQNKPRLQRWLDEFGDRYSKVVVALSVAVALIGPLLFRWPLISTSACRGSIYRALGLMVAASPCALAVAPLAYATAISSCARKGILLKGGHVLDALASCHTIAFDKTGTLTTGELKFKAIEPIYGHRMLNDKTEVSPCCRPSCEKEALAVAAAMEKGTTHPIGRAVVDHSVVEDLPSVSIESFGSIPGRGLFATVAGVESGFERDKPVKATLGSVDYIASLCKSEEESKKIWDAVTTSSYGKEFVHMALSVNQKVTLFHFEDTPRPGVFDVISLLQAHRFRVMMLTGDHESSAWRVANTVGISEVHCGLKPEDKLNHVARISREAGGGLIMVGDGINDAPALAAATVGIVLARRASATAVAVADVLLLQDNISGVPFCIAKAHQTTSLVKQNVALALTCIILASLPSVLGFLPLWLTVLLHEGGTLIVCLNSVRALKDPTWSWEKDFQYLFNKFRATVLDLRGQFSTPGSARTTQL